MATVYNETWLRNRIGDCVVNRRNVKRFVWPTAAAARDVEVTAPILLPAEVDGFGFHGQGMHATTFHTRFPAATPPEECVLFDVRNARNLDAGHFSVYPVAGTHLEAVAVHRSLTARTRNSLMTAPHWHHVAGSGMRHGFVHTARRAPDGTASGDVNDEGGTYDHLAFYGLAGAVVLLGHSQAKEFHVAHVQYGDASHLIDASGEGYWGAYGNDPTPQYRGGTVCVEHCQGYASRVATVQLGRSNGNVVVRFVTEEGCRRFLHSAGPTAGPSATGQQVSLVSNRVAFDRAKLDSVGGWGVVLRNGGPLWVQGGSYGECPGAVRVFHAGLGGLATVVEGVHFTGAGSDVVFPVYQERVGQAQATAPRSLRVKNNLYRSAGGQDWHVEAFEVDEHVAGSRGAGFDTVGEGQGKR